MNKQRLQLIICIAAALIIGIVSFIVGKGMGGPQVSSNDGDHSQHAQKEATVWTCSMHPQIKLPKPGKCPICAMDLIPLKPGEELGEREIKLSKTAEKLANIEAMPVIRKEFYFPVQMVGKISLDETRSKKITSRYAGRLDRLFVDYTGVQVKKGEHLFEIYSPQLITAQEELLQSLESAKAMKNSTVDAIRRSSEKAVEASRDKLRLWGLTDKQIKNFEDTKVITDHVTTYSPMEGVVTKKHVDQGSYVKEGSVIYSIANLDYLWVELDAYESDLQWLHYAQEVAFTTEAWPGEEFKGRVSFIHPILNNKTRTVKVRVNVDNKDRRLKPDMFVRAEVRVNINAAGQVIDKALAGKWISPMHPEIVSDKPGPCIVCGMDLVPAEEYGFVSKETNTENPLLIPSSAPLITGKRAVVYLKSRSKEGVYTGRTITLGLKAGDYYIVKGGLKQGELVVTKGAFKIDSALQIQAKPSMMSLEENNQDETFETTLPFKKSLSNIYSSYDVISVMLSKDGIEGLEKKAEALVAAIKGVDSSKEETEVADKWKSLSRELELASNLLKTSKKIDEARRHFEQVSVVTISLIKTFGTVSDVNLAYCPMAFDDKGAYWLQKAPEVENPYFGSQMFHCGDIKQKFTFQVAKAELSDKNRTILELSFSEYLKLSELLATDKKPKLDIYQKVLELMQTVNMKTMTEEVHLAFMKELNSIKSSVGSIKVDSDIKVHRQSFEKISRAFINFMKMFPFLKKDSFVFKCPMAFDGKGADWLQLNENTKNPYLGLEMQGCGDVKSSFKALSEKKAKPEMLKEDHSKHQMDKTKEESKHDHSKHETQKKQDNPKEDHSKHEVEEKKEEPKHDHSQHKMESKLSDQGLAVYFKVHKALSQDRFPETGKDILVKALSELKAEEEILKATKTVYSAKSIKEARSAFKTLSDYLIKKANEGRLPSDTNLAHCSMAFEGKGGFWLQSGDKVENPYYGSKMYRCGDIKKKISGGK